MASHDHTHDDDHGHDHGHHHHHGHSHSVPVTDEAPLDPASQSLADALRSSFRVLKAIMFFLLILFLFSGVFTVGTNQVGVVTRFGKLVNPPAEPGLHFAWPYPIDSITKVDRGLRSLEIGAFWLNLSEADRTKPLSEVSYRGNGLDPATDGALITGDQALMHVLLRVQYHISNANDFVKNVGEEALPSLIRTAVQQAAVAEAARSTLNTVWKAPSALLPGIQARAQTLLDKLESGIKLETEAGVVIGESHYPLQVRDDFIAVSDAENRMRTVVQIANKEREDKLKGAAGAAWEEITQQIDRLDQTKDEAKRSEILEQIGKLLTEKATGEAGKKVRLAEGQSDTIVAEAQASSARFLTMLDAYHESPELLTQRLRQEMLQKVFSQAGLSRWYLPPGGGKFFILNKNPQEIRDREIQEAKKKAGFTK